MLRPADRRRRTLSGLGIALALAAGTAGAQDMPQRRPGLWELTMQTAGAPSQTIRQCIDEKTDAQMMRFGQGVGARQCSRNVYRKEGDRYVGESECRIGGTTAITRATFGGDFQKSYRGEIDARYTPPMGGVGQSRVTVSARWVGACPAGWKPGDMEMPGMGRMNVDELAAGRAAKPPVR
jgi:hypothetical protein